ncbi:MAG: murein L,D-transpeptidase [Chlorobium sp.]|nr:MAG: murein L,D-transpeptidase [Chlorobium sp.]
MIAILLFWLAITPLHLLSDKPVPPRLEQPQQQNHLADPGNGIAGNAAAKIIHARFSHISRQKSTTGSRDHESFSSTLARFYAARGFQPVWTKRSMIAELISSIDEASDDGLDPSDYHITQIRGFYNVSPLTPEDQASCDILMSDALFTLAGHLRYGKVNPESLEAEWSIHDAKRLTALEYRLQGAIATERIAALFRELRPQHPKYEQLRKGLLRYRAIAREGGWPVLPEGGILKEGNRESRVPLLRRRLEASGELALANPDSSTVFSRELSVAVKRFQKLNGIEVDGVVGPTTLKVMNIPVERRIRQLRLNLERYRWFMVDMVPTCVMVNIADFTLQYIENGRYRWSTRVIVGQPLRETPVFRADMQYIVLNPQWVIPPTILAKDALPAIRKSISYLDKKKLSVIDHDGLVVNSASINWSQYTPENFPWRLQQSAGDHGALGRIKFMLPNKYIVYLHDTPNKELFAKSTRAFSSGCIRVENPVDLAVLVLQDSVRWSRENIQTTISTGKTRTLSLPKRIPVFILYLTVVPEGDDILFRDDIYNRDETLLKALDMHLP